MHCVSLQSSLWFHSFVGAPILTKTQIFCWNFSCHNPIKLLTQNYILLVILCTIQLYLNQNIHTSRNYICSKGVITLLKDLKVNSASGPDNLANRILKHSAEEIAPVLLFVFRQSLSVGELPNGWLKANVAPIFK